MLRPREQQIHDLMKKNKSAIEIADETGLAVSSVKTYMSRIHTYLAEKSSEVKTALKARKDDIVSKVKEAIKPEPQLKRVNTFEEFTRMMNEVSVKGSTLEERVAEFKDAYCKVCIYPNRCNECPTKVLMDKYLF
jgi:DNA-binding CsgD family transcriptional regulator